jgi:hypothetical protein
MYYTVLRGGLNTQFWAKYTEHLPVDYRPGKRPVRTPDWHPEQFETSQLADSDYLLLQTATEEEPRALRLASDQVNAFVRSAHQPIQCAGLWCLFQLR